MMRIKEKTKHILSFDDISLHSESAQYLDTVFKQYALIDYDNKKVFTNPIIHLYAIRDTRDENGLLDGFHDGLFFEARLYDPKTLEYYVSNTHDNIETYDTTVSRVRIFKDGSTMIELTGQYTFGIHTSISAYKVN